MTKNFLSFIFNIIKICVRLVILIAFVLQLIEDFVGNFNNTSNFLVFAEEQVVFLTLGGLLILVLATAYVSSDIRGRHYGHGPRGRKTQQPRKPAEQKQEPQAPEKPQPESDRWFGKPRKVYKRKEGEPLELVKEDVIEFCVVVTILGVCYIIWDIIFK